MRIIFGIEFDDVVYDSFHLSTQTGILYLGPIGLISLLEKYTGIQGPTSENTSLRVEQYRQAIKQVLKTEKDEFYQDSFSIDELGTASTLLQMRDDLILAGMVFEKIPLEENVPDRIFSIKKIEETIPYRLLAGLADRYASLIKELEKEIILPFESITINEPKNIIPFYLRNIFKKIKNKGIPIKYETNKTSNNKTDLNLFKQRLIFPEKAKEGKIKLKADGSIIIIRAKRETEAAEFLAKLLKKNPDYSALCIIPEKNRALDNANIQEGISSLGILSASLGRPSLQILKLVTAFLWEPIDPFKILEFLSLTLKPIDDRLALILGRLMAESPGMKSDVWHARINEYFNFLENDEQAKELQLSVDDIKEQYYTWFERKRYDINGQIPKNEAIQIFKYVQEWAGIEFEHLGSKNSSLIILKEQAKKIVELLEELPEIENNLSYLQLERIVRTIYEPAPVIFRETEIGHLPYIYNNSAIHGNVDEILWWNFTHHEKDYFFSKWYPSEMEFFQKMNWEISTPSDLNNLALWQRNTPFIRTEKRIILIIPEKVGGIPVQAHSLEGDLKAAFGDLSPISFEIDTGTGSTYMSQYFNLPTTTNIPQQQLGLPKAMINISLSDKLKNHDEETFTSLDTLFYYPYKWLFKYKIDLHKSSILSVVKENTLKGNLAHRFFEQMFREDIASWSKSDVEFWLDNRSKKLLKKEGAVLLMYGKEPDKIAFMRKVKNAAWTLVSMIQNNQWKIHKTEMPLQGKFMNRPVKGKADLVLQRNDELAVIDLKWGGKTRRLEQIKNKEDLQLVMYSRLLTVDNTWAHTSYFIISNAEMIARNNLGFREANAVMPDLDHLAINEEIWERMEKTYQWRMQQFKEGKIEIRTQSTLEELNDIYMGELMDFLEMKNDASPYDDYKTLVNLIQ